MMFKPITILLVDDDEDDIQIFKEVINREIDNNINVITSSNGLECLKMLENISPDIIFLDINMPIMGGKECLEQIKQHPDFKNIPVVIYSTSTNLQEINHFKNRGASYLTKPFSLRDLVSPLRSVLAQHI